MDIIHRLWRCSWRQRWKNQDNKTAGMITDATAAVSMNMSIALNRKTGHPSVRPASKTVSASVRCKSIIIYFKEAHRKPGASFFVAFRISVFERINNDALTSYYLML